jgi:hypothetical protein
MCTLPSTTPGPVIDFAGTRAPDDLDWLGPHDIPIMTAATTPMKTLTRDMI